jgi:quinol monooxygenase YgiN
MSQKIVTVVALFKARAGMEQTLQNECLSLIVPTRAERGCINYDLHCSCDEGTNFMFHENWASREELDNHLATPHLQSFIEKVPELVAEPPKISLWEKLA